VLGGKVRRRKLLSPKDRNVRPMMEVVRGAAFDILQSAGGFPASLRPGRWLDLYSGTGSVGIEAMSRGCSEVFPRTEVKVYLFANLITYLLYHKSIGPNVFTIYMNGISTFRRGCA
jgi:16S rRNA G966 N2-methylase RsmD